ncbi:OmpA family protein [Lacinutrix sp. Bg11-31]|uniref:OmpA family protein n=1 Tax=Lacinutrix sp. Bg11-31 TaxID=2057808 RepID=UPI000C301DD2|nr:OmpA family protein [Lacinutrix sp. Bg11-31]AUC83420.1 hypothetical protein CW733_15280 [Lacinutrix sp. Bg11-31]
MRFYLVLILFSFCGLGFSQDLPKNPQLGVCYARCLEANGKELEWKKIDCDLVQKENILNLKNLKTGVFKDKDRKVIKRKLIKIINKGYTVELLSHYFSNKSDSINELRSIQNAKALYSYLETQGVNTKQLLISTYGSSKPLTSCFNSNSCPDYYNKNTRVEYRVINIAPKLNVSWVYDNEKKIWCYKANN